MTVTFYLLFYGEYLLVGAQTLLAKSKIEKYVFMMCCVNFLKVYVRNLMKVRRNPSQLSYLKIKVSNYFL